MKNNLKLPFPLLTILITALLCVFFAASIYFYTFNGELSASHERWGTFGDFFGGVLNPTLSFLALIALLLTLSLQGKQAEISLKELKLSRTELTETRKELTRSAKAQEESEKHQQRQVRIQELTARISVITLILEYDRKDIVESEYGSTSYSQITSKDISGSSKRQLLSELGEIYHELKKIKAE